MNELNGWNGSIARCLLHWKTFSFSNYGVKGYRFCLQLQSIPSSSAPFSFSFVELACLSLVEWKEKGAGREIIEGLMEGKREKRLTGRETYNHSRRNSKVKLLMEAAVNNQLLSLIPSITKKNKINFTFLFNWFHSRACWLNGMNWKDIITVARLKLTAGMI